ncbi:MAG TPA: Fe2+-dependent dioxygenase, partial [Kiloniellaceae bacterium]|nr:Fe2+-dependent dioxygenase [Kiloniellaceae bacterium]
VKRNEQLRGDSENAKALKTQVLKALERNATFRQVALPRKVRPPLFSRYSPGMTYGRHVDDALMGPKRADRTDLSVTVFLSAPDSYEGGELEIETPFGPQSVKLPAGAAVVYPASSLHAVAPVVEGERLAAVTWVQSLVRDPARREVLYDLALVRDHLNRADNESDAAERAFKTYSNLLRMWAEP